MTLLNFLGAILLLPLFGLWMLRLMTVGRHEVLFRFSLAFAGGAVALGIEMLLFSLAGIYWTPFLLVVGPLTISFLSLGAGADDARAEHIEPIERSERLYLAGSALIVLVVLYAAVSAQMTSPDLLFFWGTKGQRFAMTHQIDGAFLAAAENRLMHPDYPPLLPLLFAWAAMIARAFSWWGAILTAPLFLGMTLTLFFSFARRSAKEEAARWTLLLAAILGYCFVLTASAGNAEPPLIFFEALALGALIFLPRDSSSEWITSVGLAGAILTKFEGLIFVSLTIGMVMLQRRGARSVLRMMSLPALALGCWIVFCAQRGLLHSYRGEGYGAFSVENAGLVLGELTHHAGYHIVWLPWVVVAVLWLGGSGKRESVPLILIGLGFLAFILFSYLHDVSNVRLWIAASANRTLMTPLLAFFFAAVVAGRKGHPGRAASTADDHG